MKRIFQSLLLACGLLVAAEALTSSAFATTYYVDSAVGSDTNTGLTMSASGTNGPFLTPSHATPVAGDTVYILPGKGYGGGSGGTDALVITASGSGPIAGSSSCTSPVTYSGYPGLPMPIISGTQSNQAIQFSASGAALSCVVIQNMEVAGWAGSLTAVGGWTQASTGSCTNLYCGCGIQGSLFSFSANTNSSTTSNTTLFFASSPGSSGVQVGDIVIDQSNLSAIPVGTTVTSVGTSTVINATVTVASGATIQFRHPSHHITLQNLIVHDFPGTGIQMGQNDYVGLFNNIVYNNANWSILATSGISVWTSVPIDNVTTAKEWVIGNVLYNNKNLVGNNSLKATATTTTGSSGSSLHLTGTNSSQNGWTVMDATHPTYTAPGTYVLSGGGSATITMSQAFVTPPGSGDSIVFTQFTDGEGLIIDDNTNDQINWGPYNGRVIVQNNLTFNNGSAGILSFSSGHVDVSFNTSYDDVTTYYYTAAFGSYAGITTNFSSDNNFYNNIAVASSTANNTLTNSNPTGSNTFSNNLGYNGANTLPGGNNVTSNPNFVNPSITPPFLYAPTARTGGNPWGNFFIGFQLQPGSPAIDAGSASFTRAKDFLGNNGLVGPSYDMGAYESPCSTYGSSTIRTPTFLMNSEFQNGQAAGSITPGSLRDAISTLSCGRSPYAQ